MTTKPVLRAALALTITAGVAATALALLPPRSPDALAAQIPGSDTASGSVLTVDDGYIEEGEGISPFADDLAAIAKLDPDLRAAMQAAAHDAIADGFDFIITSGWRSAAYQQQLFDQAVLDYGSADAASELVSTPQTSRHTTGDAVDIGRTDADSWMSQHGADYGLCQIYANEMWHFELAATPGGGCPAQLSDASQRG